MDLINNFIDVYMGSPKLLIETILLLSLCIFLKMYYPKFRGITGEFWVKLELNKLSKSKYKIFNDIMIEDNYGTHQIDHIILSNYGIFVIETKNYYGLIKGKEYDNKWCQYLGKCKNYFLNPLHQNYRHIKALANMLKLNEKYFVSIVCFSNQAKIDVQCKSIVTHVNNLIKEIKKYKEPILNIMVEQITNIIIINNITNKKRKKQHIKHINNKIKTTKKLIDHMICPNCGNNLEEKIGKYGKFIGCSNFPKCKYIKK